MFNLPQAGLNLIKRFEGCTLVAYLCPANVWTIGYGHTGSDVCEGREITMSKAEEPLRQDAKKFVDGVHKLITVVINQNQFDALVSFAFNLGLGALKGSTLLKYVNEKKFNAAALQFVKWNKANGHVLNGLTLRRQAEAKLFIK